MKKPAAKEIEKAREQVEHLFTDRDWYEVMKHWQGECWHKSEVMCGMLVGLQIAENRRKRERVRLRLKHRVELRLQIAENRRKRERPAWRGEREGGGDAK